MNRSQIVAALESVPDLDKDLEEELETVPGFAARFREALLLNAQEADLTFLKMVIVKHDADVPAPIQGEPTTSAGF